MAKKKSKRGDSRGYGQTAKPSAPSNVGKSQKGANNRPTQSNSSKADATRSANDAKNGTSAVKISLDTHEDIVELLKSLQISSGSDEGTLSKTRLVPDRFSTKLAKIVDQLDQLGFTQRQLEDVALALGYTITVETALDWLCFNLKTQDLPPLFTEGQVRESVRRQEAGAPPTIDVLVASSQNNAGADDSTSPTEQPLELQPHQLAMMRKAADEEKSNAKKEVAKQAGEAAAQKAWLLSQYAYEEDGNDDDEQSPSQRDETAPTQESSELEAAPEAEKTPEEIRLESAKRELEEAQADLNNDANNYMRSKQETKQLANHVKKLKQQVGGMEKKISRAAAKLVAKAAPAVEEPATPSNDIEEEEEGGVGMLDLFGSSEEPAKSEVIQTTPSSQEPTDVVRVDYSIPKGWTGTTPQKTLEEWLKKRKLPRPKYHKISQTKGCRLVVSRSKKKTDTLTFEMDSFQFIGDPQSYVATEALYALDRNVPLYRVFPPAFRDLWLSWIAAVQGAKNAENAEIQKEERDRLDQILTVIQNAHDASDDAIGSAPSTKTSSNNAAAPPEPSGSSNEKRSEKEAWDDSDSDDDSPDVGSGAAKSHSTQGTKILNAFLKTQATSQYKQMKKIRDDLPMFGYRAQILQSVKRNPVTILCAETGAGKTTQCPQYILEDAVLNGKGGDVNVICTQPRRVAATSVAERVAAEMCDTLGNRVGYQIRMESKRSDRTKLLFCTTGVVLRRLQDDQILKGITHVIVDEVHERQQQTDVLLIGLRRLLRTSRPDLKVILMSATLDSELFCSFFGGAPFLSVPGRTFPVSNYFLEDLLDETNHIIDEGSRYALRQHQRSERAVLQVTGRGGEQRKEVVDLHSQTDIQNVSDEFPGYKLATRRSLDRVNEEVINYDLLEDVLELLLIYPENNTNLLAPDGTNLTRGSFLVFLPGLGEIRTLTERLQGNRKMGNSNKFEIVPMHSTLSSTEQRRAFQRSKPGQRKIILATNIAETSVTIPDVVCVIDAGRVREVRQNKRTSTSTLVTDWCSKASAKQRAGRAGRVQAGLCLKLYSSRTARYVMKAESEPELRRVPLEEICLSILASRFATSCNAFLQQAPQPPEKVSIQAALDTLIEVGAIVQEEGPSVTQEKLTPLGMHLARLPVDVRAGKMLLFGALFCCLDSVLTIAAALSSKSPFATFINDADIAKARHKAFLHEDSDFLTLCNVFDGFRDAMNVSQHASRRFCESNYLSYTALREIRDSRNQYLDLLCASGFVDRSKLMSASSNGGRRGWDNFALKSSKWNMHSRNNDVVHLVVGAGLFPNVAHLVKAPGSSLKDFTLWHKTEQLYFHSSSVNAKMLSPQNLWVMFHEKFGTAHRVSISTTCLVHPFCLILFGQNVSVDHLNRKVIVNGWMEIGMAAQTGVLLRALRNEIDSILLRGRMGMGGGESKRDEGSTKVAMESNEAQLDNLINGIVQIVAGSTAQS